MRLTRTRRAQRSGRLSQQLVMCGRVGRELERRGTYAEADRRPRRPRPTGEAMAALDLAQQGFPATPRRPCAASIAKLPQTPLSGERVRPSR